MSTSAYHYNIHYPAGYEDDTGKQWPVLITLHGAGERHISLDALKTHHYYQPMYELTTVQFPSLVVVPHCPPKEYWEPPKLNALLDRLLAEERIDPDRVYLSGFSMGGYGTWTTAGSYPERYAAIAPICGGGDPRDAERLKDLPTWAFHGALDNVVPMSETMEMIEAVRRVGGNPQLTIYPEGDHNVWDETYENPELYRWLLDQHRMS